LPILPTNLQRHPCPLGRQNYCNKADAGEDRVKKNPQEKKLKKNPNLETRGRSGQF